MRIGTSIAAWSLSYEMFGAKLEGWPSGLRQRS